MMDQYLSQACLLNQLALCCQYVNNFQDYGGAKHEKVSLQLICLKGVNIKADTSIRYVRWLFDIHWPLKTFILTSNPKPHSLDDQPAFDRPEIFYLLHPIVAILILMENQDDILC